MLLTITLGVILGVTGTALVHQWLSAALGEPASNALPPAAFPRLAPLATPRPRRAGRRATQAAFRRSALLSRRAA